MFFCECVTVVTPVNAIVLHAVLESSTLDWRNCIGEVAVQTRCQIVTKCLIVQINEDKKFHVTIKHEIEILCDVVNNSESRSHQKQTEIKITKLNNSKRHNGR
jgi:hypothetical protein